MARDLKADSINVTLRSLSLSLSLSPSLSLSLSLCLSSSAKRITYPEPRQEPRRPREASGATRKLVKVDRTSGCLRRGKEPSSRLRASHATARRRLRVAKLARLRAPNDAYARKGREERFDVRNGRAQPPARRRRRRRRRPVEKLVEMLASPPLPLFIRTADGAAAIA